MSDDTEPMSDLTPGTSDQQAQANPSSPQPQIINQDGKQYAFSPGLQGSLTAINQGKPSPSLLTQTAKSKVIGPPKMRPTGHGYAMAGEHHEG